MFFERNLARAFLAMFGYNPSNKPVPLLFAIDLAPLSKRGSDRENLIYGRRFPKRRPSTVRVATGRNYIDWPLSRTRTTRRS